jgi:hypothetical protein
MKNSGLADGLRRGMLPTPSVFRGNPGISPGRIHLVQRSKSSTSSIGALRMSWAFVTADATHIELAPASTTETRFEELIPPIATIGPS